jgi:hypothetical protein
MHYRGTSPISRPLFPVVRPLFPPYFPPSPISPIRSSARASGPSSGAELGTFLSREDDRALFPDLLAPPDNPLDPDSGGST